MNWSELEGQRRVATEPTSKSEIDDLFALAERNLSDASLAGLSSDGRFSLAYNAARTLATIAIRACGYRVRQGGGAHYNTFLALPVAMGEALETLSVYFDTCRQSRNDLIYDASEVVSKSDAAELVAKSKEFKTTVEEWLRKDYPDLI